ncbi:MAG: hypothetical protein ABIQ61_14755 [Ornithinibacter sp.]
MRMPWPVLILAGLALALAARLVLTGLPRRSAVALGTGPAVLLGVGVLGLVGHCAAMFYRNLTLAIPGTGGYVDAVNGMGLTSKVLYAVPALLVLIALRRLPVPALAVLTLAFAVVGVTMYDGSALTTHLGAILFSVLALAGCLAGWVLLPRQGTPRGSVTRAPEAA